MRQQLLVLLQHKKFEKLLLLVAIVSWMSGAFYLCCCCCPCLEPIRNLDLTLSCSLMTKDLTETGGLGLSAWQKPLLYLYLFLHQSALARIISNSRLSPFFILTSGVAQAVSNRLHSLIDLWFSHWKRQATFQPLQGISTRKYCNIWVYLSRSKPQPQGYPLLSVIANIRESTTDRNGDSLSN